MDPAAAGPPIASRYVLNNINNYTNLFDIVLKGKLNEKSCDISTLIITNI